MDDEVRRRHQAAVDANEVRYRDPLTGLSVFTSVFLKDKGYCCGSGCRHCPWPVDVQKKAGRPGS